MLFLGCQPLCIDINVIVLWSISLTSSLFLISEDSRVSYKDPYSDIYSSDKIFAAKVGFENISYSSDLRFVMFSFISVGLILYTSHIPM